MKEIRWDINSREWRNFFKRNMIERYMPEPIHLYNEEELKMAQKYLYAEHHRLVTLIICDGDKELFRTTAVQDKDYPEYFESILDMFNARETDYDFAQSEEGGFEEELSEVNGFIRHLKEMVDKD